MVLKNISPGCGVRASLMLFLYVPLLNCAISVDSYISINKTYSFIIYRHFLSQTLFSLLTLFGPLHNCLFPVFVLCFTSSVSHGVATYFPGCGVGASVMLFS